MSRLKSSLHAVMVRIALTGLTLGLALGVVSAASGAGSGQGRHEGQEKKGHGHEGVQREEDEAQHRSRGDHGYRFEAHERAAIFGYYANRDRRLPPGIAKRNGDLPPGLAKQIQRNGVLPPGLQKRLEPLPIELERQLPPLSVGCGCRRALIGTSVVLIRTRSNFILDVVPIRGR